MITLIPLAIPAKRHRGRPTKPALPGTRASLGLKVTSEIKHRLDAAAHASGRTQSQEAEYRLDRSFQDDRLEQLDRRIAELIALLTTAQDIT